ncbi:transposase [Pleurocapsales cyanobacterium LEGE 06147]|nr:transposase [Pleurocapsales cyanobacterium LEGE 06147]
MLLDDLLEGKATKGTLKLWCSQKGIWYALISLSKEVPDSDEPQGWIGVDRGQNNIAVASLPSGMAKFWNGRQIKHLRRRAAKLRKSLQKAKKLKTVKRLESKERRLISYINHCISKQLVAFAKDFDCGLVFEDLSGIRQTSKQRKKNKSDAGENRDFWSFYQLENSCRYKSILASVPMKKRPAAYTSKSCCKCGVIGKRNKHSFVCVNPSCNSCHNADWGGSQNIGQWDGFSCAVDFQKPLAVMVKGNQPNGVYDSPLNQVSLSGQELESPTMASA